MTLEEFIYPTQKQLFNRLCKIYDKRVAFCKGHFLIVKGSAPIMLVAHLDTVHEKPVKTICTSSDGNILMSPEGIGGDDRCGVYALAKVYDTAEIKPWLLFTCNEEIGGIGADMFCRCHAKGRLPAGLDDLKFLVEIDRKGNNDAVYYDCANPDFEDFISEYGFKTAQGSFSDISYIAPELGVAAVNLSSGYYNAHRLHEYINLAELEATIEKVSAILKTSVSKSTPRFDYVEAKINQLDDYYFSDKDYFKFMK